MKTKLQRIQTLVFDLGWDYQRMSQSGQGVYNELCNELNIELEN
jgi:hypothetical protein